MIIALKMLLAFTFLTGLVYPIFVTGVSQVLFPGKANGSVIVKGDKVIGSELIGQNFLSNKYFKSRPSAVNYDPKSSGATNLSITSKKFQELVKEGSPRVKSDDLLTASASGLDPHITPEAALEQIDRIAIARGGDNQTKDKLRGLIGELTERKTMGFLGNARVNVLKLNSKLDDIL